MELLLFVDAIKHFHNILWGKKIMIADSKTLQYHIKLKKQPDSDKIVTILVDFVYKVIHIKGEDNPPDFLSRNLNTLEIAHKLAADLLTVELC